MVTWLRWWWLGSPTVRLPSPWFFPTWPGSYPQCMDHECVAKLFYFIKQFLCISTAYCLPYLMLLDCLPCSSASPPRYSSPRHQKNREGLQEELIDIILLILERNPQLHYYQGYHDIVVAFLLVLGERLATSLVEKLSTHHLRYPRQRAEDSSPRDNSSARFLVGVFSGLNPTPNCPPT